MWSDWNAVFLSSFVVVVTIGHTTLSSTAPKYWYKNDTTNTKQERTNEKKKKKKRNVLNSLRKQWRSLNCALALLAQQFSADSIKYGIFFVVLLLLPVDAIQQTYKISRWNERENSRVWKLCNRQADGQTDRHAGECGVKGSACRHKSHRNTTKFTTIYFLFHLIVQRQQNLIHQGV